MEFTDYRQAHMDIYRCTNIPKYRSFKYRLLQRSLVTNIQLNKWDLIGDNSCSFCSQQPETVLHLITTQCQEVRKLWRDFAHYIVLRFKLRDLQLNDQNILLNNLVNKKHHVVNFLCLITKQYIYAQRCLKKDLSFNQLKLRFNLIENMKKYIAVKKGTIAIHDKKWKLYTEQPDVEQIVQEY